MSIGHDNIEQTMRHADFHPAYREVKPFYETVADEWGIGRVEDIARGPEGRTSTLAHVPCWNEPPLATEDDIYVAELGGIFESAEELAPFLSSPSPAVRQAALIAVGEVG